MKKTLTLFVLSLFFALDVAYTQPYSINTESGYSALKWRNIGPYRGGRSLAVAGHKDQPYTYYFGATGGGVYKTTDGGMTWLPISDAYFSTSSVGAIAVAESDPNVVIVGMGETDIRGNISMGDGIYGSLDAGKTWTHLGLKESHAIGDILIHPKDASTIWVAAMGHIFGSNEERGVFKSTDGGKSWRKVLYINDKTGAVDLTFDPNNPRMMYATTWEAFRNPWMMSSGGEGSGLWKSTDGGESWTNISSSPGLPKGILGKIGVDISPANTDRVYAIIENENGGVFVSENAGKSWKRVNDDRNLRQRAWYYSKIYADPQEENVAYVSNVGFWKTIDGGKTFERIRTQHGDSHELWIDPTNNQRFIEGNDGSANITYNGGKSWSEQDVATSQFYHVTVDEQFPYHVYGAQQDNSTVGLPSRTSGRGISNSDFYEVAGGESGYISIDPKNPNVSFGGSYGGYLTKYNRENDQNQIINVWPENPMGAPASELKYRFQWTFPIFKSKHGTNDLYTAAQFVFKSTNDGKSWEIISEDLTRNDKSKQVASGGPITKDNTSVEYYNTIFALAESPLSQGVLWAGSDDGLIHLTKNGGQTWEEITPKNLPAESIISMIDPSHHKEGTAYVAVKRYKMDDFKPYIYKTSNYGKKWTLITKGIPEDEYVHVVREDPKKPGMLYAGTEKTVYVSFNDGEEWHSLRQNLPITPVRDLVVHPIESDLVIATHGRSFWILDDVELLHQVNATPPTEIKFYTPADTYRMKGYQSLNEGSPIGTNPVNGVTFYYYFPKVSDEEATLTIYPSNSVGSETEAIISFSSKTLPDGTPANKKSPFYEEEGQTQNDVLPAMKGMNQFVWNMRYSDAEKVKGAILWGGSTRGPKVNPGTYKAVLKVGDRTLETSFVIKKDPRIDTTPKEFEEQLTLLLQIREKLTETHKTINRIRSVKTKMNEYLSSIKGMDGVDTLIKASKPILSTLAKVEEALIQVKAKSIQDVLNFPIKLNNKLAALASTIESADTAPTQQSYEVFRDLSSQIDIQTAGLEPLFRVDIPAWNALVKEQNIPIIHTNQ